MRPYLRADRARHQIRLVTRSPLLRPEPYPLDAVMRSAALAFARPYIATLRSLGNAMQRTAAERAAPATNDGHEPHPARRQLTNG